VSVAAGLDEITFPDTVSAGGVYTQGGAVTATLTHAYTFDGNDTASGSYAVTVTDRAGNESTVPFTVTRDASGPAAAITATLDATTIHVAWSATDPGSGVAHYDVAYKVDDGAWVGWFTETLSPRSRAGRADHGHAAGRAGTRLCLPRTGHGPGEQHQRVGGDERQGGDRQRASTITSQGSEPLVPRSAAKTGLRHCTRSVAQHPPDTVVSGQCEQSEGQRSGVQANGAMVAKTISRAKL